MESCSNFKTLRASFTELMQSTNPTKATSTSVANSKAFFTDPSKKSTIGREFTSIHIRRGDYYKPEVRMDLVQKEWFLEALQKLERTTTQILIFSDDPKHEDVTHVANVTGGTILSLNDLSPAEELILMSLATNFICSNSTFSWWAAALSNKAGQVVFPKSWTGEFGNDNWIGFPREFLSL